MLFVACQRDPWNDRLVYCDPPTPTYDQISSVFINAEEKVVSTRPGPCTSRSTRLIAVDGGYDLEDELADVTHVELDERPTEERVIISYRQNGTQQVLALECLSMPRPTMWSRFTGRLRSTFKDDSDP